MNDRELALDAKRVAQFHLTNPSRYDLHAFEEWRQIARSLGATMEGKHNA